jgi:hypothetical protein
MHLHDDTIVSADITKIHAEINQFRNQEFLVSSGAIAAFATTAQELPRSPLLGAGVLVLLLGLFFWHYVLTDTRSRLSAYLRVARKSGWERDYRVFADKAKFPGQRQAAVITFLVLGALTIATTFSGPIQTHFAGGEVQAIPWLLILFTITAGPYFFFVVYFGQIKYPPLIDRYERLWREVLKIEESEPPAGDA